MMACTALPAGAGFISSMTNYLDCQAQILASAAWQALAAPGSSLSIVLSGFLTISIALIGYNLLLGNGPTVRSGTLIFVKIGAVLALATSWPAYRTLVYDLVVDGPGQMVAEIGPSAGAVGSDGTLLQRLDLTDQALAQLAVLGPGNPSGSQLVPIPPPPWVGFNAFALGGSRIMFLLTAIAGLAALRIVAGLMLALGPFFIAFLMFDSTRSLFEGWVRVLAGAALSAIGVTIALGLQLSLLEPWVSNVLARRMAGEVLPTVATELFVVCTLFATIVIAVIAGCIRLANAFRLSPSIHFQSAFARTSQNIATPDLATASGRSAEAERSRAAAVANVLMAMGRREKVGEGRTEFGGLPTGRPVPTVGIASSEAGRISTPTGRTFSRRPNARVSAGASKRDMGA